MAAAKSLWTLGCFIIALEKTELHKSALDVAEGEGYDTNVEHPITVQVPVQSSENRTELS